jgi:hypothetical protein
MKPVVLVVLSMMFFGIQNTIVGRFFPKVHPAVILFINYVPVVAIMGAWYAYLFVTQTTFTAPTPIQCRYILVSATIFILGDLCIYGCYYSGGTVSLATTATLLVPVFAIIFRAIMGWGYPNIYTFGACVFGAITLAFATLSDMHEKALLLEQQQAVQLLEVEVFEEAPQS